jgi:DNA-binding MarR family transcriptional regulator
MHEDQKQKPVEIYAELFETISDQALKSSVRLMILVSLAMNKRMNFSDLLKLTGSGKGSLHNHITKLESAGYISTKKYSFFSSPKLKIEITERGIELVQKYLDIVSHI